MPAIESLTTAEMAVMRAGIGLGRGALVRKAANQTTANYTVAAAIAWDQEVYDTDSIHDNVTNNTRLTVPAGVTRVRLSGQVRLGSVTVDVWSALQFNKNGSGTYDGVASQAMEMGATAPSNQLTSPVLVVSPGDYFELVLEVETDTDITVEAARSWFAMEIVV